jgi:hypothetical protein
MASVSNLVFKLGETWIIDGVCHDSLGNYIALSGCAVKWRMALNGVTVLDLAIGSGITLVNNGNVGEILITITPAMQIAVNLTPAFCQHQCRVILQDGVTVTDQFYGSVMVQPSLF